MTQTYSESSFNLSKFAERKKKVDAALKVIRESNEKGANRWMATPKQELALKYLKDNITTELVYGGAAGGSKTYLGCAWLIMSCMEYPETRWLMGRAVLKQLTQTTLLTFFYVAKQWGLEKDTDYSYNSQSGIITFANKSQIYLKDLFAYPSDPDFDSLGSAEYTGAFIDEASQVTVKCKNIVRSRLRYKLDEYGLLPKLLMTCNPSKNFLYTEFYKPWRDGELEPGKAFIPAKIKDNPFLPLAYIKTMMTLDRVSKERLLYGNWDYDEDPAALMEFDAITDMYTNTVEGQIPGKDAAGHALPDIRKRYISADIARMGNDKTVIAVWYGLECVEIRAYKKTSTTTSANLIKDAMRRHQVPASHVIIDEDGIGGGVLDQIYGAKGFIAQTRPFKKENYKNLKSQCAFKLAELINTRQLAVRTTNEQLKNELNLELMQYKRHNIDKDGPLQLIPKELMKMSLGRSPDYADTLMMRMFFEYKSAPKLTFI